MRIAKHIAIVSAAVLTVACGHPRAEGSEETRAILPNKAQIDSASYLVGMHFGSFIIDNDFGEMNWDELLKGLKDYVHAKGDPMDSTFVEQFKVNPEVINEVLDGFLLKRRNYKVALNKEKGDDFMAEFLQKPGTQRSDTGLGYMVVEPGNDKKAVHELDTVWVNYVGRTLDGVVFDRNENFSFTLQQVIPGWSEGVQKIGEGGTINLVIPADLAYGEYGNNRIEPNATLLFDIDLLKVGPYTEPVQ